MQKRTIEDLLCGIEDQLRRIGDQMTFLVDFCDEESEKEDDETTNRMKILFFPCAFIDLIGLSAAVYHISWIACLLFVVTIIATPSVIRYGAYKHL